MSYSQTIHIEAKDLIDAKRQLKLELLALLGHHDTLERGAVKNHERFQSNSMIEGPNRGFVIAEKGIRLHETPTPYDKAYQEGKGIYGRVYAPGAEILVLNESKYNKGWLEIETTDAIGFIEKHYIKIIPIDPLLDSFTSKFYYISEGDTFENQIAKVHYSQYKTRTGDDYRTIAQAFYLLNQQGNLLEGISLVDVGQNFLEAIELGFKASLDPYFINARQLYKKIQLMQGHIVRLPSKNYIRLQQELGNLSKRPDFMNKAIDIASTGAEILAGTGGLVIGIIEGILRGIYDAVEGIVDLISMIIKTIKDLITGELFEDLKDIYQTFKNISGLNFEDFKNLVYDVLGNIGEAIKDTIENWANASAFEKGRTIGIIIGVILLEILIAVFTGGSASLAKWAGKLGKFGKVLNKVAKIGDKVSEKIPRGRRRKGDYDNDVDPDGNNWQRWALLQQARITAESIDASGGTTAELMATLKAQEQLYPKLKVSWPKEDVKSGSFDLYMKASPKKKVIDDFTSGTKIEEVKLKSGKKGAWNKELSKSLKPKTRYNVDGYLYDTDDLGRVKSVKGKLKLNKKGRNTYQQQKSVTLKDGVKGQDDGGHLIAQIFDGPGEQINYVPQKSSLNRGEWKTMEMEWKKALEAGKEVEIDIQNVFSGESKRPNAQLVTYKIDGNTFKEIFDN